MNSETLQIIEGKKKDLGDGFVVRRSLPTVQKRMVGPFVFFDHMGPVDLHVGQSMDVRPHPHIGLSTLTYLFEGEIIHRDTLGVEQAIRAGAVNWMTAGRGVAHSERSSLESRQMTRRLHGLQIWVALPKEKEEIEPSFDHIPDSEIPDFSSQGHRVRLVAGEYQGTKSPVPTHSDLIYLDLALQAGGSFDYANAAQEIAVYCVEGEIDCNGKMLSPGQLAVIPLKEPVRLKARTQARAVLFGGEPLPEPRHIWWNFVSSSKARIEQAKQQWREQAFGHIKGESEFIPLPNDP